MGWRERVSALLGVSAYQPAHGYGPELDDRIVEAIREELGGQLQPMLTTKTRWYLKELESAQVAADAGNITPIARLYRAMRRDGMFSGLLGTRTSGLVRLPKRFYGDKAIIDELRARNGSRSVFDEMCPPSELAALAADGIVLGVGVAELVPVPGRDYPVLVRLDPEFLQYRWQENTWYFQSVAANLPITPGDGRWVLHTPGARMSPWTFGQWPSCGRSYINKEHSIGHRSNYSAKLANPARVAVSPQGATEAQKLGFLRKLMAWGINTVFALPVGWDAKLIESNGRGIDIFQKEIDTSDLEFMVSLAGQIVTTTGGKGFISAGLFQTIRQDLIQGDADGVAYTANTQVLPAWIAEGWGEDALDAGTGVEWDTDEPKDKAAEAQTMVTIAAALRALREELAAGGRSLNVDEVVTRFGIPLLAENDGGDTASTKQARKLALVGDTREAA